MSKLKAIFLDFDGVVLESVDVKTWAFAKLFEDFKEQNEEIVSYHAANGGVSRYVKIRYIYEEILKLPLSDELFDELCQKYSKLVFDRVVQSKFVAGAEEFLDKSFKDFSLYVISGTPQDEMREIVKKRGIDKYFEQVYGSPTTKDVWVKKILDENKWSSSEAVFVGDALSDCEAAEVNGCDFFARIAQGDNDIFEGKKINYRIKDLVELDQILQKDYQ